MPDSILDRFRKYLESRGRRLTRERSLVVETVAGLTSPFDAEAVIAVLSSTTHPHRVSLATVYRTLDQLEQAEIILQDTSATDGKRFRFPGDIAALLPESVSPLCRAFHENLIAGKCPWCGRNILNGEHEN